MRNFRLSLAAFAIAFLGPAILGQVFAQASRSAVPAIVDVDHRGLYVGLQAGYGFAKTDVGLTGTPLSIEGLAGSGAVYGAFAGYQLRFGDVVVGPFVEWAHQDLKFEVQPALLKASIGDTWTVGGQLGWAFGKTLPYVFAGYSWADADIAVLGTAITSTHLNGVTAGAGIEFVVAPGLKVGGRYAYTRWENEDLLGLGVVGLERDQHVVTGRLSYQVDLLK